MHLPLAHRECPRIDCRPNKHRLRGWRSFSARGLAPSHRRDLSWVLRLGMDQTFLSRNLLDCACSVDLDSSVQVPGSPIYSIPLWCRNIVKHGKDPRNVRCFSPHSLAMLERTRLLLSIQDCRRRVRLTRLRAPCIRQGAISKIWPDTQTAACAWKNFH